MNQLNTKSEGEHYLWVDTSRCIGCFGCEVACKMEHELPAGPRPIMVIQIGPVEHEGELILTYQPATCLHCNVTGLCGGLPDGGHAKEGRWSGLCRL